MNELTEKWSVGRLLDTPTTRGWSEQRRMDQELVESCMVFLYFKESDQGRSRMKLANCGSPDAASNVVRLHNALIDAYLAQAQELEKIDRLYKGLERMSAHDKRRIQKLETEVQALKDCK